MQSNTAVSLMTTKIPVFEPSSLIAEVEKSFKAKSQDFLTINYVYVIDKNSVLVGVVSIREMFKHPGHTRLSEIMTTEVISVRAASDREKVAALALKHNLKAMPVIDKKGRLLGVVTSDVILNILHSEGVEDMLLAAGISGVIAMMRSHRNIKLNLRNRLPWLLAGLFGGILAAAIVSKFNTVLEKEIALAAFVPVIVYIADSIGTQTEALFLRFHLSYGDKQSDSKYLHDELRLAVVIGVFLATALGLVGGVIWGSLLLGVTLWITVATTTLMAVTVAVCLPMIFLKLRLDPAAAAGPLATIICDIMSLAIYFTVAHILIL